MNELQQLWEKHSKRNFPAGHRGKKINDIDLTVMDSDLSTCVLTFINTGGTLGPRLRLVREKGLEDLEVVVAGLEGEGRAYFEEVQEMLVLIGKSLTGRLA